jgi:glutathione S-transferase
MTTTLTAFAASPDRGRGLARDMQVRWALEEVGQPYDVRLLSFGDMKQPAHRALEEFSNLPAYVARGEARPAFQRAFAAQLKVFTDRNSAPTSRTA